MSHLLMLQFKTHLFSFYLNRISLLNGIMTEYFNLSTIIAVYNLYYIVFVDMNYLIL